MNLAFVPWGWSGASARDLIAFEFETKSALSLIVSKHGECEVVLYR
jgi:hypothetical protein